MNNDLRSDLKGTAWFGIAVAVIFLGGGVGWSMLAPLSGAVIASGVIGFENKRKTVQHLEGGIIREILVKDGDLVMAGTTLLILDDTSARARTEEARNRIRALAAEQARLSAERAGERSIDFSHPLLLAADDAEVAAILARQKSQFATRAANLGSQREILVKRVDQLKKQIEGSAIQLRGVRTQLKLIREEANVVEGLVERGYERKPRLLALQRSEAQAAATEGELGTTIARGEEAIGETELRIGNLVTELLAEVDARLTQVTAELTSTEKLYLESLDRLARTRIVSPIDGIVVEIRFKTVGGVIRSSEPILDVAPARDDLIVNVRIRPSDIDEVAPGLPVKVVLSAFQQRYVQHVNGEVISVSADSLFDQKSGAYYFAADVRLDRAHLEAVAPELQLAAGMPAEVFITTAPRTVADFLIQPFRRSFDRAFREI